MASTFKLFTDSGLTTPYSGTEQLLHKTDGSDGEQTIQLHFGSAETAGTRELQAASNPGVDQVTLTPTIIADSWAATTTYALGDKVLPTTPDGFYYEVTAAGDSGGSEPTWPASIDSTVVDGTVTWTCVSTDHDITEIKLAATSGGLAGATPGAAFNLGTTIQSGSANAVEVWVGVTNSVSVVSNNTGEPELGININEANEYAV